jgi:hypothetical protein
VPVHPLHPDLEELAAWQAGELSGPGGARVEAHITGCADCAGLVAAVERGHAALAELAEVEPPAGLHERLATAIEREAAAPTATGAGDGAQERRLAVAAEAGGPRETAPMSEPVPLDGRRRGGRRSPAGRRRIAVLSTAAAVVLLVAGLVPLLRHVGGQTTATQTGGGGSASASNGLGGGSAEGSLPVFSAPGGYSGSALQSALTHDPKTRSAYRQAIGGSPDARPSSRLGQPTPANPQFGSKNGSSGTATGSGDAASGSGGRTESTTSAQASTGPQQRTCVATARNQAGGQGLRPAFFVTPTVYRGRPATVLVTVRPGAPDQADLWAFPRDDCSAPPFAHDRVTVTPP